MNKTKDTLLPSLESFDEGSATALDHTDTVDYTEATANAYAREAAADGRDLDRQIDALEGGYSDVATLESLIEALEDARDVGLESGSAQFLHLHVGPIQQRYGINELETAIPAMECFHDRRARLATSITMESIQETLLKVWAWLKEQFVKFMTAIKDLFRKVTKSLDLIADEADALKQKVRRMKFDGGEKFDLGRAGRQLVVDGEITKDFTSPLNTVGQLSRVAEETLQKIHEDAVAAVRYRWGDKEVGGPRFTKEVPVPAGFTQAKGAKEFIFSTQDALNVYVSKPLPGDRFVVIGTFGEDNQPSRWDSSRNAMVHGRVGVESIPTAPEADLTVTALSASEVFSLCQRLQKTVASLKTARQVVEDNMEKTRRAIDELAKNGDEKFTSSEMARKVGTFIYRRSALYGGNLFRVIDNVAYDVCRGYLTYAKRSAALAEKKVAPKEATGPVSHAALPSPA